MSVIRAAVCCAAITAAAGSCFGADKYWQGTGGVDTFQGGPWLVFNGSAWVPTAVPSASDRAFFNRGGYGGISGAYTVGSSALASFGTQSLNIFNDRVTLALNGATWQVGASGIAVGQSGTNSAALTVQGGTLRSTGQIIVERLGLGPAELQVGPGGLLQSNASLNIGNTTDAAAAVISGGQINLGGDLIVGRFGTATLAVATGGDVLVSSTVFIGQNIGSSAQAIVGDPGSTLSTAALVIGRVGTGNLSLLAGADAAATSFVDIGQELGGDGSLTAEGTGTTLTTPSLVVGLRGDGSATLTDGASITCQNFVDIGSTAGVTGTATVSGTGSTISTPALAVGLFGNASLSILDGATVDSMDFVDMARFLGSTSTITLTGAGSRLGTSNISVGIAGTGTLVAEAGAHFDVDENITVAREPGSIGTLSLNGTIPTVCVRMSAGYQGAGAASIVGGSVLTTTDGTCVGCEGGSGQLEVSGAGSKLLTGFFSSPYLGTGDTRVLAGGVLGTAPFPNPGATGNIASEPNSIGSLLVSGPGSTLAFVDNSNADAEQRGFFNVGYWGSGSMVVEASATADVYQLILGSRANNNFRGDGGVTIQDPGTLLRSRSSVYIGGQGDGTMVIQNGARAEATEIYTAFTGGPLSGFDRRSIGNLQIIGTGSIFAVSNSTQIGTTGEGILTISSGGRLTNPFGTVGYNGFGTAIITGAGSRWNNSSNINVGRNSGSDGTMIIQDGGLVTSSQHFWIGEQAGSTGRVTVTGGSESPQTPSTLSVRQILVGQSGSGELTVSGGAKVRCELGAAAVNTSQVAVAGGITGNVLITGPSSELTSLGSLIIANGGNASFTVEQGAAVSIAKDTRLSQGFTGDAELTVRGDGSSFACLGDFEVGTLGSATVTVTENASISANRIVIDLAEEFPGQAPSRLEIVPGPGSNPSGVGTSSLTVANQIIVGGDASSDGGAGTLLVNTTTPIVAPGGLLIRGPGIFEAGTATVQGPLVSSGTIKAALAEPMALNISGSFVQSPESVQGLPARGTLDLRISSPTDFDAIHIGGTAQLGGTLIVRLDPALDPAPGSLAADVLTAQAVTRPFDVVYLISGFTDLRTLTASYQNLPRAGQAVRIGVTSLVREPDFPTASTAQTAQVSGSPTQAAAADLNRDGYLDVAAAIPMNPAVPGDTGAVAVVYNLGVNPDGTWRGFADPVYLFAGIDPIGVAVGDLIPGNGPEIATINRGGPGSSPGDASGLRLLVNDGTGTFTPLGSPSAQVFDVGSDPRSIAVGNFVSDFAGALDVAVTSLDEIGDGQVVIRPNTFGSAGGGGPGFLPPIRYPTSGPPSTIEPGGLDNPKDLEDLAVCIAGTPTNPGSSVDVFLNNNGSPGAWDGFAPPRTVGVGAGPRGLALADLDADGDADIVTGNQHDGTVSIALNQITAPGGSPFRVQTLPVADMPGSVAVLDLDQDTDPDIAVVTRNDAGTQNVVRVLRNDSVPGSGVLVFSLAESIGEGTDPQYILPGNVDGDPDADIIAFTDPPASPQQEATAYVNAHCTGDVDGNRTVNVSDLVQLLFRFGRTVEFPNTGGDGNGDRFIDTRDLAIFLVSFGRSCP